MLFLLRLVAFCIALGIAMPTWGASTADPTVPVTGLPYTSAPIRNNFQALINDTNGLLSKHAATAAPTLPALGEEWLNTTSPTSQVLSVFDGTSWVPIGTLNPIAHTWVPSNSSGLGVGAAATNVILKAMPTTVLVSGQSTVLRQSFATPNDGGAALYTFSSAACDLNGGTGDNGKEVQAAGGGCWNADFNAFEARPEVWGAKGDGATDDNFPLQAALSSGVTHLALSAKPYRSSAQLNIPDHVSVVGDRYQPNTYGVFGSVIKCDAAIAGPCVVGGGADNQPWDISKVTIARGPGVVPAGGACLSASGSQLVHVEYVECYNHDQGFVANTSGGNGIYAYLGNVLTCRIADTHVLINSLPGFYMQDSTLGCNGAGSVGDLSSNSFVKITGNWDNTFGTVHFTNVHFNQGAGTAQCFMNFANLTGTTNIVSDIEVIGGHVETAQKGFCSDSTVKGLQYFQISGLWMAGGWGGANALWSLDPATKLFSSAYSGDTFTGWTTASLAPTGGYDDFKITGSSFPNTPLSIVGTGSTTNINLSNNTYQGLTVSGSFQGPGSRITGVARSGAGSYSYTFTGNLEVDVTNQSLAPCTVALAFAGGSGLTQTLNLCKWQIQGSYVDLTVNITVTGLGSSSGNATLTGLPQPANGSGTVGMSPCYNGATEAGLSTATNSGFYANPVGNNVNLFTQAATSLTPLTVSNFTGSGNFSCTLRYPLSS